MSGDRDPTFRLLAVLNCRSNDLSMVAGRLFERLADRRDPVMTDDIYRHARRALDETRAALDAHVEATRSTPEAAE